MAGRMKVEQPYTNNCVVKKKTMKKKKNEKKARQRMRGRTIRMKSIYKKFISFSVRGMKCKTGFTCDWRE